MGNITRKLHIKRTILFVIIIIWMTLVFALSNQNSNDSTQTSLRFLEFLISMFGNLLNKELNVQDFMWLDFTLRKIAHFSLYFCGSIPVVLLLKTYNFKKTKQIIFTILFCFCYACGDEIHQLFSDGRNGNVMDILIDTVGGGVGIVFIELIMNLIDKFKRKILKL